MKFICFLWILFVISGARAFTLNSSTNPNFQGWPGGKVYFLLNEASCPANVPAVIQKSFEIWEDVASTRLELHLVGTTTVTGPANPVTIYCEVNFSAATGGLDEDSIPGLASIVPDGDFAGTAELILNNSAGQGNVANFNPAILEVVVAHEVGHVIGLGHSQDTTALMYFNASAKTTLSLAQDDIDGLNYLYPRDELGGDQIFGGCAQVSYLKPPSHGGGVLFIFFLLLMPLTLPLVLKMKLSRH